jgi:hypothetical protein
VEVEVVVVTTQPLAVDDVVVTERRPSNFEIEAVEVVVVVVINPPISAEVVVLLLKVKGSRVKDPLDVVVISIPPQVVDDE